MGRARAAAARNIAVAESFAEPEKNLRGVKTRGCESASPGAAIAAAVVARTSSMSVQELRLAIHGGVHGAATIQQIQKASGRRGLRKLIAEAEDANDQSTLVHLALRAQFQLLNDARVPIHTLQERYGKHQETMTALAPAANLTRWCPLVDAVHYRLSSATRVLLAASSAATLRRCRRLLARARARSLPAAALWRRRRGGGGGVGGCGAAAGRRAVGARALGARDALARRVGGGGGRVRVRGTVYDYT